MKRILGLVMLTTVLVCCEVGPREVSASNEKVDLGAWSFRQIHFVDDIEYHLYQTGTSDGGMFVINHTKEKLEVELLQKQLDEINKRDTLQGR